MLDCGWSVIGISRNPLANTRPFSQIQVDIGSADMVERLAGSVQPCSAIVHAAASLHKGLYASDMTTANCLGTQQMLRLASVWGVAEFVFISSISVVGVPQALPITEEHPVAPRTAYHASKLFGEHLVAIANQQRETNGVVLRIPSPIGAGMPDNRILSVFVRRALSGAPITLLGHGSRRQNYVDVRDVARAVESCVRQKAAGVYHIAGETSISNLELADTCKSTLNSSSPIIFSEEPDPEEGFTWDVSIEKASRELGYQPRCKIEDSIVAVARQYANRPDQ
jgi:UDP-glucose 4-epimerase